MKKLRKLTLSPEKMMVNEDLINLKGGYGDLEPIGSICYDGWMPESGSVAVLCHNCLPKLGAKGLGGGVAGCFY